jgi:hypothetical protein
MELTKEEKKRYNNFVLEASKYEKCDGLDMKKKSLNLYLCAKDVYANAPKLCEKIRRLEV